MSNLDPATAGLWSSIALTVLTGIYVALTYRILKASKDAMIRQMRPYVMATLVSGDDVVSLVVVNIGARPARNVVIDVTPALDMIAERTESGEILLDFVPALQTAYMPPNLERHTFIGFCQWYLDKDHVYGSRFQFDVSYADDEGRQYGEKYDVEFPFSKNSAGLMRYTVEYSLSKMAGVLKDGLPRKS